MHFLCAKCFIYLFGFSEAVLGCGFFKLFLSLYIGLKTKLLIHFI